MCGIIGFVGPNTVDTRELLFNLLKESTYRGRHSLGWALFTDKGTGVWVCSPDELTRDSVMWMTLGLSEIRLIAHTRYCTSDPDFPLPIVRDDVALVLNGVISQEPFETWNEFGQGPYAGHNDAEIALRLLQMGQPQYIPGSYAMCYLGNGGQVLGVRSPERPLWWHSFQWHNAPHQTDTAYVFTSTLDIALRADTHKAKKSSRELRPGVVVCLNNSEPVFNWATTPDIQMPTPAVTPCNL